MSDVSTDYEQCKLDLQRSEWLVVLGADYIKNDFKKSIEVLNRSGYTYYAILHDKDEVQEGVLKYPHYHLVITTNKRPRASTIINLMCSIFDCSSVNVSVCECLDLVLSIQYLIHKNDFDKFQYNADDIITNDCFNDIQDIMKIKQSKIIPSTDTFIKLIAKSKSRLDLMQALGITKYAYYRSTIDDICRAMSRFDLLSTHQYRAPVRT